MDRDLKVHKLGMPQQSFACGLTGQNTQALDIRMMCLFLGISQSSSRARQF